MVADLYRLMRLEEEKTEGTTIILERHDSSGRPDKVGSEEDASGDTSEDTD